MTMHNLQRPFLGLTMGDPLGIGPEILVKALSRPDIYKRCRPFVIGDMEVMEKALELCSSSLELLPADAPEKGNYTLGTIDIMPVSDLSFQVLGLSQPDAQVGKAMETYILTGVDLAQEGRIDALVTAPITKTGLAAAGSAFHGHTEMIAHRVHAKDFSMMLAGATLKVVLVTIHVPLSEVAGLLTIDNIVKTISITHRSLQERFGISSPRVAVAGLNPHAGEQGMFGDQEENIILPAVEKAQDMGMDVYGPLPSDTVFYHASQGKFHAVVCMYHDQGLIPFKLLHFSDGVNTTLGLPIIRTSVDHGTAYDIAWQGKADPSSLVAAIDMAVVQALAMASGKSF